MDRLTHRGRAAVCLAGAAALLWAQQTFEIRGTVIEAGTGHALEGVDVTIVPGNGASGAEPVLLKTDSQGSFRFTTGQSGAYVVRVQKAGYSRVTASAAAGASNQRSTALSESNRSVEMRFELQRPGGVAGQLLDAETDAPLAHLRFNLTTWASRNGRPRAGFMPQTTDAEGRFQVNVPGGSFIVGAMPQVTGKDRYLTTFTLEDAERVDLDYRYEYFPGGPEVALALPLRATSGAAANFGAIRLKKQDLYRVHVKLDPASCPEGRQLVVRETMITLQVISAPVPIPCAPFLLTHTPPGEYELQLNAEQGADQVSALARFTVAGRNLELPLALSRGVTLAGTLLAAEGAGEVPLSTFTVSLGPVSTPAASSEIQPHAVDERGRFAFLNIQPGARRKVNVAGLGAQFYVKEVRYRGAVMPGGVFDFAGAGELEVEIDRNPAALTGTVMDRDKPVAGADVVFLRWPPQPADDQTAIRHVPADAEGRFQITGLAPGEYRIFAVAAPDRELAEQPLPWQRLGARAERVRIARNAAQTITVQVSDPGR